MGGVTRGSYAATFPVLFTIVLRTHAIASASSMDKMAALQLTQKRTVVANSRRHVSLAIPHQATYLNVYFQLVDGSFSPQINEEGRSHLILPKNRKRSAMLGRGDGKRNGSEERNWGSQCFSTLNEMRQPRDALLLTPKFRTELKR
ncbi:hypothetical protein Tco_1555696 [Tanacetum coccineum]